MEISTDMDLPAKIFHGTAGDRDASSSEFTLKFPYSAGKLRGVESGFTQAGRPVGHQSALRRTCGRIFRNSSSGSEYAEDVIDRLPWRGSDHHPSAKRRNAIEVRTNSRNFVLTFKHRKKTVGLQDLTGLNSERILHSRLHYR